MTYEVQHFTLCNGWTNTWTVLDEDDTGQPETFATEAIAQAALNEFLAEIEEEIALGQRGKDEGYDPDEFRVIKVSNL